MTWTQSFGTIDILLFVLSVTIGVYSGSFLHELAHYIAAAWNGLSARIGLPLNPIVNKRPLCQISGTVSSKGFIAVIGAPALLIITISLPIILITINYNIPTLLKGFIWGIAGAVFTSVVDIIMVYRIVTDPGSLDSYNSSNGEFDTEPGPISGWWIIIDFLNLMDDNKFRITKL